LSSSYKKAFRKKYSHLIENYVSNNYHVDHIYPIKAFVENNIFDLDIINCDDNLQLLEAKENISKNDKYNIEEFNQYIISKKINIKKHYIKYHIN
jgi:hypothetical protein